MQPGPDSLGLLGMREREAALGGTIEVAKMPLVGNAARGAAFSGGVSGGCRA